MRTAIGASRSPGCRRRNRAATWLLGAALLLAHTVGAMARDTVSILFVTSHTTAHYLHFVEEARQGLGNAASVEFQTSTLPASQLRTHYRTGETGSYDMIVVLGTGAVRAVAEWRPAVPVLYALIPKASYEHLKQSGALPCPGNQCTAVYIDQPLTRIFDVLEAAFGSRQRLGVLLGPTSAADADALSGLAREHGLTLHTAVVKNDDELLPALNELLKRSDVLLSLADPVVYNRRTAKSILLTTYRYKIPVLAYSRAYADAGAALSVYSTPRQISRQTSAIITAFFRDPDHRLPPPEYPRYYKVRVNRHVADSLGLDLANNPVLQSIGNDIEDEKAEYSE